MRSAYPEGERRDPRNHLLVQAFNAGRGGNLKADTPVACKTETSAPETGDYDDEPTVFFRQGQFPSAFD